MSAINFVGITFKETVMLKYQLKLRKQEKASIKKFFYFLQFFSLDYVLTLMPNG